MYKQFVLAVLKKFSIIVFIILFLSFLPSYAAGNNSINVFQPGTKPYGLTYEEHVQNFLKWVLSLPVGKNPHDELDKNPWNDKTGEDCASGQLDTNSSVFYLSGNGGGVDKWTCEVPAGKGLFIPVSMVELSLPEIASQKIEDLHTQAKKDQDSVRSLYLKIEDKEFSEEEIRKYRVHTDTFDAVFPKYAMFGVTKEGPTKAVGDGYYLITEPVPKGNYTIIYKSSILCMGLDCTEQSFAQDITYKLIVK